MVKGRMAVGMLGAVVVVSGLAAAFALFDDGGTAVPVTGTPLALGVSPRDLLYGRVTTVDGATYEGTLRWGGDQEALWGDPFNGFKGENPWAASIPSDQVPRERASIRVFGREMAGWEREMDLSRPFMARFGDIERIERRGRDILVALKNGTEVVLDRMGSDDLGDGLRVWDAARGTVDLDERQIRTVELMAAPGSGRGPVPLRGTVRTEQGDFTGLVEWNREHALGSDELLGREGEVVRHLPFDTIRSIERSAPRGARVTLLDGTEMVLTGTPAVGDGNRGVYVDDPRYGRVQVPWTVFERVDFTPGGPGPGYDDFPPGAPLRGSVVTRSGASLAGRLVFDLDESETTETLDAPWDGVTYMIPFGLVASIARSGGIGTGSVTVTLRTEEDVQLEPEGDLGEGNAGMLVFSYGSETAEYVPWADVRRIDFDPPPATYPAGGPLP